ncbi:Peptidase_M3 domain-containing protein [Meloidogyne graminicola]|uniref:Peptidase_M3 domain-containing protein n=1 Tax=Meloidogyne graminicola TaxID=189291 RepID=A0A8S9Z8U9_9BILA|nr:Peptidase_M3 domain-containing protein [Meloidogyne graminicola]
MFPEHGFSGPVDSELEQILQLTTDYSSHKPLEIERQLGYSDLEFASSIRRSQLIEAIDGNQSISKFFHFGAILDGFELIVQKLYGISFKRLLPEKGEKVYRDDENNETFLGDIFIDVDARPSKLQGDCHFTIRCSKLLENGQFQTPIVVVLTISNLPLCSLSNLLEKLEMSHQQAENFFFMKWAMQCIQFWEEQFFQHVAGTRCPTDFAEILQKICRDVSGRFMDSEQASTLIKCRRIFPAIHNTQQAIFSLLDLEIHGEHAADISQNKLCTTDLFLQLHKKALPQLNIPRNYAYHHRISHLVMEQNIIHISLLELVHQ